jgi:TIR domain
MAVKIFINYRRDDSIGMAGRLHDRLAQTFGRDNLFMDADHIPVGANFVTYLNDQVAACDVILVVIGPKWLRVKDKAGQRRLHQADDFVAIEIAAALSRNIRVIPVLVEGARMPKASDLPDSLKPLDRRQAVEMRHAHFGKDAEALLARMGEALGDEALVSDEREALGDEARETGRWRVWPTLKKHLISTAIGLVIGLLVLAWLQPLTSGGISLLLLLVVAVANAGALLIPASDKTTKVPARKKKTSINSAVR